MGWSWAVFFIQAARRKFYEQVAPSFPFVIDKVPCEPVAKDRPVKFLCIDNFAAMGAKDSPL
eukprot:629250-Lingulodinium_polyedra.AAC.1